VITLFTCPKPFRGHEGVIQRNALRSWLLCVPGGELLLLGNEDGVADTARELGAVHLPDVVRNDLGTPLLSSVFSNAQRAASRPVLAYLNADIILLGDLPDAVRRCRRFRRFLLVGRRTDLDVQASVAFGDPLWREELGRRAKNEGRLHFIRGIDYFVFRKGSLGAIPPFAVGRPAWDNWLVAHALRRRFAVVDLTATVTAIHQNHAFAHVREGTGDRWEGREAEQNRSLAGPDDCDLLDCNYRLAGGRLSVTRSPDHVQRRMWRLQGERPALWNSLMSWKVRHALCFMFPEIAIARAPTLQSAKREWSVQRGGCRGVQRADPRGPKAYGREAE
jgi:hypothetical protein